MNILRILAYVVIVFSFVFLTLSNVYINLSTLNKINNLEFKLDKVLKNASY